MSQISHLFTTVGDLDAARTFWTEVVGLEILVDQGEYLRVGGDAGAFMGIERASEGDRPEIEIVVRVADVDAAYERLLAAGVRVDAPPQDMPWGARHLWLHDPDGRRVSVYSGPPEGSQTAR